MNQGNYTLEKFCSEFFHEEVTSDLFFVNLRASCLK